MTFIRHLSCLLVLAVIVCAQSKRKGLGQVDFPTSGSGQAQIHFLRGVAALHSFWYPKARMEFREATRIDSDFMMGYWGEAMTHNHPIWGDPQNTAEGRKAIAQAKDSPKLTARERAYIEAVRSLYGKGEKPVRDHAYREAMARIHQNYPKDLEASAFYALALLGTAEPGHGGLQRRMQAAALVLDVYRQKPNHPGAAHYILHAFDDPDHAILALPAARRYAEIAPDAPHALHMPSHIFLQLGMWPEAAASNEAAWAASTKVVQQGDFQGAMKDFHSLQWLQYVYLQQGRYRDAERLLKTMKGGLADGHDDKMMQLYAAYTYSSMAAALIIERERWDETGALASELTAEMPQVRSRDSETGGERKPGGSPDPTVIARAPLSFAQGLAAAMKGSNSRDLTQDLRTVSRLSAVPYEALSVMPKIAEMQLLEIAAVRSAAAGRYDAAMATMEKALGVRNAIPAGPLGPPSEIKPPRELFGEILLRAGRPEQARQQFALSLKRHPKRARSLLGYARSSAKAGDEQAASETTSGLLRQWQHADADLEIVQEVRKSGKK